MDNHFIPQNSIESVDACDKFLSENKNPINLDNLNPELDEEIQDSILDKEDTIEKEKSKHLCLKFSCKFFLLILIFKN